MPVLVPALRAAAFLVLSGLLCSAPVNARPDKTTVNAPASSVAPARPDASAGQSVAPETPVVAVASSVSPSGEVLDTRPSPTGEVRRGTELVLRALSLLGVHYRLGGNSPDTGFDCSGLVRHVFREALGLVLPRRSEEISRTGTPINTADLKPGDLVFFNTLRRTFSHVGIYIGNQQFVHAPSSGGGVRVEDMNGQYWVKRFDGARRVLFSDPAVAAALAAAGLGSFLNGAGATANAVDGSVMTGAEASLGTVGRRDP